MSTEFDRRQVGGATVIIGDCREVLKSLPDQSVHTCITSPPYFGLRDYGHSDQIGLESSPQAFVDTIVSVFREVRRVLRDDGTIWVNLGDSYSRSPNRGGSGVGGKHEKYMGDAYTSARAAQTGSSDGAVGRANRPGSRSGGLGEKQLLGIPWRVAFALQDDGWILRQDIIWSKPNPMPESVRDRCTKAHEYVFLLSKSARYYFDMDAIREPVVKGDAGSRFDLGKTAYHQLDRSQKGNRKTFRGGGIYTSAQSFNNSADTENDSVGNEPNETGMRNKRSVWTVATQPFSEAHFATYPIELIRPCVLAGCPQGGVVLDPFGGAGTTALAAFSEGRKSVLIELNPEYAEMACARIDRETRQSDFFKHDIQANNISKFAD